MRAAGQGQVQCSAVGACVHACLKGRRGETMVRGLPALLRCIHMELTLQLCVALYVTVSQSVLCMFTPCLRTSWHRCTLACYRSIAEKCSPKRRSYSCWQPPPTYPASKGMPHALPPCMPPSPRMDSLLVRTKEHWRAPSSLHTVCPNILLSCVLVGIRVLQCT
jgi:hypothetical protein